MKNRQTYISKVIRHFLRSESGCSLHLSNDEVIDLCELGLGPITWQLADAGNAELSNASREILMGANATARFMHEAGAQAMIELVETFANANVVPVLLKGISIADQFYEPAWCRTMGDIDVLVSPSDSEQASECLSRLGYLPDEAEALDDVHHHLPAVRHPESGVIVEVHTGLFRPGSVADREPLFAAASWNQQLVTSEFRGITVRRFQAEFQLAYTVAHWVTERKWPFSVFPFVDAAILTRQKGFNWEQYGERINGSKWLTTCSGLMLAALADGGLVSDLPKDIQVAARADFGTTAFRFLNYLVWTTPLGSNINPPRILNPMQARSAWQAMLNPANLGSFSAAMTQLSRHQFARMKPLILGPLRRLRRRSTQTDSE
ncbi:MAG: nucleotidyltransferase family protein [Woeseiaceae bacterium]